MARRRLPTFAISDDKHPLDFLIPITIWLRTAIRGGSEIRSVSGTAMSLPVKQLTIPANMKGIVLAASSRQIGDYTTTEIIGRGGYGSVYRAADSAHGRDVAIKVLDGELDEARRRRFDRERQTMGRLSSHPNIVSVYDSGYTEADEAFIVMELAAGGSLRDRLRQKGPLPWKEATTIIIAIAKAAQAAHDAGVFHRDIKPDNILIDHFHNPKLADFGIASVASNATATTTTTATLAHAAPEVLQGQASSPAVDIYALGSTLFALISGRPPFLQSDDDTIASMIGRALTQPPPDIRTFGVPDQVARVIEKSLAKDANGRQPSAAHLADELSEAIGHTGGAVRSPESSTKRSPGNQPHETRLATPKPATPPPVPDRPNEPAGLWMAPEPSGQYQAPYQATPPPQWNPSHEVPAYESGQISRRPKWLWPLLATGVAVLAASALYVSGVGRSTNPADADDQANATNNEPAGEFGQNIDGPAVRIDCPTEIAIYERVTCDVLSSKSATGSWHIIGFQESPEELITVPGKNEIFIEPKDPDSLGRLYRVTAEVVDDSGRTATTEHQFEVVSVGIQIDCPTEIPPGETVCQIVTFNATAGEWRIDGLGGDNLQVVPGRNPIVIELNQNPDIIGQTYTIEVTATGETGESATETASFTIVE